MLIHHYHDQKVYQILCPGGSRVRRSEATGESVVYVPTEGGEVPIFEHPSSLLVELARERRHGLRLIGVVDDAES